MHASDCLIVIPAYNEAATVAKVVAGARAATGSPVLVVSDASDDDTVAQAQAAGARVLLPGADHSSDGVQARLDRMRQASSAPAQSKPTNDP